MPARAQIAARRLAGSRRAVVGFCCLGLEVDGTNRRALVALAAGDRAVEDAVELVAILGALKASQGVDRQAIAQEQAALQEAEAAAK